MTPYDRLKSLPDYPLYLRPDLTVESLHQRAITLSDNQAAKQLQQARSRLFQSFNRQSNIAA